MCSSRTSYNIDNKIANYIYSEKGIELSRETAEKVKEENSSAIVANKNILDILK